jgi:hypothetical protein
MNPHRYNPLTETSTGRLPKKPESRIGVTLGHGCTLELMDDNTLQLLNRDTKETLNLGPAPSAGSALQYALERLQIHFK